MGEPAGERGLEPVGERAPHVEERQAAARAVQPLVGARNERVDAEGAHVDRDDARGLVGVEHHEGPGGAGGSDHRARAQQGTVGVRDERHRDDGDPLVDRPRERLGGHREAIGRRHRAHAKPAALLRLPQVARRRKIERRRDDRVAVAARRERGGEHTVARGGVGAERDLVVAGADQLRERAADLGDPPEPGVDRAVAQRERAPVVVEIGQRLVEHRPQAVGREVGALAKRREPSAQGAEVGRGHRNTTS